MGSRTLAGALTLASSVSAVIVGVKAVVLYLSWEGAPPPT
jgi:hypothetical protein